MEAVNNNPNAKCSLEFHFVMYFFLCNLVGNSEIKSLAFCISELNQLIQIEAKCTSPKTFFRGTGLKSTFQTVVNVTRQGFWKGASLIGLSHHSYCKKKQQSDTL